MIINPYAVAPAGGDPTVKVLLHFDGANGSTTLTDSSQYARTSTVHGSASLTTTTPEFGAASGNFPGGASDYWTFPNSTDFEFGSGDFTLEGWLWVAGGGGSLRFIISNRATVGLDAGFYWFLDGSQQLRIRAMGAAGATLFDLISAPNVLGTGAWHAVSVVRDGANAYMYVDGVQAAVAGSLVGAISTTADDLHFGNSPADNRTWNGKMDEWRIKKGVCLYPGGTTYTPTGPFANP